MKLTKAQANLLKEIADFGGGMTVSETYAPAQKLVTLGLAELKQMKFGGHWLIITPAGRNALNGGSDEA